MDSFLWFSGLLILGVSDLVTANLADENTLKKVLFTDYDMTYAPQTPVELSVTFHLMKLVNVNADDGLITVDFLLGQSWKDPRLAWDPREFNTTNQNIVVPQKIVFLPDMKMYNGFATELVSDSEVLVYANGGMYYVPYIRAEVYCDLPSRSFEGETCEVRIGPWSRTESRLNLTLAKVEPYGLHSGGRCSLGQSQAKIERMIYPCCPDERYSIAVLTLNISCFQEEGGSAPNSAIGGYSPSPYFLVAPIALHFITGLTDSLSN